MKDTLKRAIRALGYDVHRVDGFDERAAHGRLLAMLLRETEGDAALMTLPGLSDPFGRRAQLRRLANDSAALNGVPHELRSGDGEVLYRADPPPPARPAEGERR